MSMFDAPIPGQSLMTTPKNYPHERPPEMSKLNEVLDYYMDKMTSEESIDNILELLYLKTPVNTIVNAATTIGVMQGLHTTDVKLLVSPVLHEYIKTIGKRAGIEVEDELENVPTPDDTQSIVSSINQAIDKIETDEDEIKDDEGAELMRQTAKMLDDTSPIEENETEKEEAAILPETEPELVSPPQEEKPQSLMSRRGTM